MKMLVTDYDETFYLNDDDIKINIEAVKKFKKDNIFVIATGRSWFDYNKKKELYNIECDYVILNHGSTIIKENKIIYNKEIDNNIKNELIKDLKIEKAINYFTCSCNESRLSLQDEDLTKIHVKYETKDIASEVKNIIENKYSNYINCFLVCKNQAIEIVSKEVDKVKAINIISNLLNINKDNIYTIGDSYTDIEMIKEYNGARMINCIEELKSITDIKYESVSNFIEAILNNKI